MGVVSRMHEARRDAIASFWRWFQEHEGELRAAFCAAARSGDHPALQAQVERVGGQLAQISPQLTTLLNGHPEGPMRLAIRGPDAQAEAVAREVLALAPPVDGWSFGGSIPSAPRRMLRETTPATSW
jgi:hypothetical protein